MNKPQFLTKSKFTHCLDCPTKLYYKSHSDEYVSSQDDDDFLKALAEGGIQVGELAKLYYPGGVEVPYSRDKEESVQLTNELLERDSVIIYEAAIQHKLTYALVDILVKSGDQIDLIEVKSKSWPPPVINSVMKNNGKMRSTWQKYFYDVAFQTWVMNKVFPAYKIHPKLMLIDKEKPATVDGLHQYFKIVKNDEGRSEIKLTDKIPDIELGDPIMRSIDVSDEVNLILHGHARDPKSQLEAKGFEQWIEGLCNLIQEDQKYPVSIGAKCRGCEHRVKADNLDGKKAGFNECWKEALGWSDEELRKPHVFDVWYPETENYINDEIYLMQEMTPRYLGVNEEALYRQTSWTRNQRKLAQVMKMTGRHDQQEVLLPGLIQEMNSWRYPLHFIDFEGIAPAIPFYKGCYPYKKVPFQFSVHTVHEDGRVEHSAEWIDRRKGVYPGFDFVRELKSVLEQDEGSVFMYHHYEKTTLNDVKDRLLDSDESDKNELIDWINTLVVEGSPRELIDQQQLIVDYYYSVHMGGSNSIKDVLPAVLKESKALKEIYSNPYSGLSLQDKILYQTDDEGDVINPYQLLDPVMGYDVNNQPDALQIDLDTGSRISEGGTAMMAWARMQFDDVAEAEREKVFNALLRYCELDTLAMVMIYQHWDSLK